jgi:hypothetical protein
MKTKGNATRKLIVLGLLLANAPLAHAGWEYWDHGRRMWTNGKGEVEDVEEIEQQERAQEIQDKIDEAAERLQDKLEELNDKLQAIRDAQEGGGE